MAQQQQNITLDAPGFQGINTEESPIVQDVQFAKRANNAVIDNLGRIGARKGFSHYTSSYDISNLTPPAGQDSYVVNQFGILDADGVQPVVICEVEWFDDITSLGKSYEVGVVENLPNRVVFVTRPATTYALKDAQIVRFNDPATGDGRYLVFNADDALTVDPVAKTAVSLFGTAGAVPPQDGGGVYQSTCDATVACSAYGRVWMSGFQGDYSKIHYSSLLNPTWWYDGKGVPTESQNTGGIIDVSEYWPNGKDRIQAIVAHNNMLVVFGRESILMYGNPQGDPAAIGGIFLQDAIDGMGLVGRDAVCSTGSDIYFLDETGVRSLGRSVQEQSSPIGDMTMNVRTAISVQVGLVNSQYSVSLSFCPAESFVVCNFAESEDTFVLDTRRPSATGGARITTWSETPFWRVIENEGVVLMTGKKGQGLLQYSANVDNTDDGYTFVYESNTIALGDLTRLKFPKKMDTTVVTRNGDSDLMMRWGFDGVLSYSKSFVAEGIEADKFSNPDADVEHVYWGEATYSTRGDSKISRFKVNTKGSGNTINIGIDAMIQGGTLSVQQFNAQLLLGRID